MFAWWQKSYGLTSQRNLRVDVTGGPANLNFAHVLSYHSGDARAGTWRTVVQKNGCARTCASIFWLARLAPPPHDRSTASGQSNQREDGPLVGEPVSSRTGAARSQPARTVSPRERAGVLEVCWASRGRELGLAAAPLSHALGQQATTTHRFSNHVAPSPKCMPTKVRAPIPSTVPRQCVLGMTLSQNTDQENGLYALPPP